MEKFPACGKVKENGSMKLGGSRNLRMRLLLSTLTSKPIIIRDIRTDAMPPGLLDHEASLLYLLAKISVGCVVQINETGTNLRYRPGTVMGGNDLEHDCGTSRSIGYFLEPLIVLGLFGQKRLTITLKGITNDSKDPSVDTFRTTTLPLLKKFGIPSEHVDLKIECRGVSPLGGGKVALYISPFVHDTLKAITWIDEGLVESVRGFTFSARVPGKFEHKMLQAAHKIFDPLLRNVHINTDHKAGTQAGKSPGYGISLVATTTTGCCYSADTAVYHGRADEVDDLDDETKDSSLTDDHGEQIALALLDEIKQGGVVDSRHQGLLLLLCALCPPDVSKVRVGKLSPHGAEVCKEIQKFLGVVFDIKPDTDRSTESVTLKCVGSGLKNHSRAGFVWM